MEWLHEFFSRLYNFQELIRWGGYTVLVIVIYAETGLLAGFFLPGDSLLVTAGVFAAVEGALDIRILIPLLGCAAIAGDNTGYWLGRHFGPKLFSKEDSFFFHKNHLARTQKFYDRYGAKTIILARFVPIVRTFAPTVAGVGQMPYKKFLSYSIGGGLAWIASMTLLGFTLGRSIPNIEKKVHYVIAIVIFLSFLPILKEWLHSRKKV
ncbi:MAG TPA: VTT domain-containing protein [Candidatus Omnitrophota bacterium]|nr:VTT domain-containing protein [Candidatus Omnitrophota bacterium]HPS36252.1 VTT domain-containing protein [Candidatus Omnitrophota bacterium]